ncbi:MAG: hypothetical protein M1828_000607 [Chrysothrix sp. TS-e1954]|nr:MAG: hypothetical protein M1828_000607 [Chrysothrix sp. TS-e1954]
MLSTAYLVAALAPLTLALPAPTADTCSDQSTFENANFDDLGGIIGTNINTIPTPYKGLDFQGFTFASIVETDLIPGVIPHSGTRYALTEPRNQLIMGTSMLTTNFPDSTSQSFSLKSFYYGCQLDLQNGAAAVPTQCNIELTGYCGNDNSINDATQKGSRQFQYNPTTALGAQQMASSGDIEQYFKDVDFIIVTSTLPAGEQVAGALLGTFIDDVEYDLKTCS